MKNLKSILLLIFILSLSQTILAQPDVSINDITGRQHPRILLLKGEEQLIEKSVAENPVWKKMHVTILNECDRIIALPPVERIQIGRRLLDKSREALRRIFFLSYAWRMTGEDKYFKRCEQELLAVSKFSDWNPSHFLDVAEMTMAVAIGYDWLYPGLSDENKRIIREAMVAKGLNPSMDPGYNGWLRAEHNWNQVCNAGMTFGALAVAEDYPELSKTIVGRALRSIPLAMKGYEPDGAYPEGYNYWGYGTSFNVMFLSAVEKVFSTDFGLTKAPGFMQTSVFLENMTAVTGSCYNWGDSREDGGLNPAMFWFSGRNDDPTQLWIEKNYLQKEDFSSFTDDRLLPAIMIWGKDIPLGQVTAPKAIAWKGQGANPVALMRTSWDDPNGIYLGFKAGSPSVNHAHMDVGSFIMEAEGVRWASDFGMQEYESLESKGIALWGRGQDAQRWTIFRLNNKAHNTLTINNQLQQVKGYAKIDKFSDKPDFTYAVSDLSSIYSGELESAKRGVAIVDQQFVVISDELIAANQPTTVRWTMMTTATPELSNNSIKLTKDGKTLVLKVNTSASVSMKTWPTAPTNDYDAANPGTTLVGFELTLKPSQKQAIQVLLIPGSVDAQKVKFEKPIEKW
jgi:hypothetical protein